MTDPAGLARELAEAGVAGLTIVWADNNGIPRSRTVPVQAVEATARRGVGATPLLAVFDTHDAITYAYEGLSTPSGDVRHIPVLDRAVPLAGQPSLAWAPSRVVDADGVPWALDPRGALEAQVAAAAEAGPGGDRGLRDRVLRRDSTRTSRSPRTAAPPTARTRCCQVDELVTDLLRDLDSNGADDRPAPRRVRPGAGRAEPRRHRPDERGRRPAARPPDDPRGRAVQRPARELRAAHHLGGRRAGLAPAHVRGARRAQPARRRSVGRGRELDRRAAAGAAARSPP